MGQGIGIACGVCDTFSPMGTGACPACGGDLSLDPRPQAAAPAVAAVVAPEAPEVAAASAATLTKEELMEQARNYVCKQCSSPVPSGHKFCGACGATVPKEVRDLQVDFFGGMQAPGKARLILIRGDQGVDGLSYLLQGQEHVAGRQDAQILFPDDAWLSPRHANFIYRGEKLVVRDEGSKNGVYVRVRQSVPIKPGDLFLCGDEVFRLDATPKDTSGPEADQTYYYSSPKRPSPFRIIQVLKGGADGMVFCAREKTGSVGREECDLNFPEDIYMSGNHAKIEMAGDGSFTLTDQGSKNGTYYRIDTEQELTHGDYLFLGKQLLRVEMTT
ncbi:MAG: hypothetical protein DRJ42_14385 [Deltaproteobacteria bacterium]|nr:MAG: hypothetical protein DRJ42_14385 [Deltaproteobacteria bacterium]